MSQVCELISNQLSDNNVNSSTKYDGQEKLSEKELLMQAETHDIRMGAQFQAQIYQKSYSENHKIFHRHRLNQLKIWDASNKTDPKQVQDTYKLIKRKFGRGAYDLEDFFILLSRTNQDPKLIQELVTFEEKFLKTYFLVRNSERIAEQMKMKE